MSAYTFSVLDTRTSEWKKRRQWWLDHYNIQSELGRENLIKDTALFNKSYTSVFDARLTELVYEWFLPKKGGTVLDPFAGGSVRGIVCTAMGHEYTGIDISEKQIEANRLQSTEPHWIVGDSNQILPQIEEQHDLVFTCPPYHDLEIYSTNPNDLSTQPYEEFLINYQNILNKSINLLKDNRFMVIVVSEIRDQPPIPHYGPGYYKSFVQDTINICKQAGLHYYNDIILVNSANNAAMTHQTYFERNKKFARIHQNVLVFVKGNPDLATYEMSDAEPQVCIEGKYYKDCRHASIALTGGKVVPTRIKMRCQSKYQRYKDWHLIQTQ